MEVNSGGYLPSRFLEVNIHRYSPTPRRIIVLVFIIQHKFSTNSQIVILFSDEKGFAHHFFSSGSRQEVNITPYPETEDYPLVLYILTFDIILSRLQKSSEENRTEVQTTAAWKQTGPLHQDKLVVIIQDRLKFIRTVTVQTLLLVLEWERNGLNWSRIWLFCHSFS